MSVDVVMPFVVVGYFACAIGCIIYFIMSARP
jgi:hypothetical protein